MRLKFSKTGTACFISHLDLIRCMTRAFQRAGISIRHTQGYNPRPHMVFAVPLSLGIEGMAELMDICPETDLAMAQTAEKLNANLPPEIRIIEAYEGGAPFREISRAEYILTLPAQYRVFFENFIKKEKIIVDKKTRHGIIRTDIRPYIETRPYTAEEANFAVKITLPAGSDHNISMRVFLDAFFGFFMNEEQIYTARRIAFLDRNGRLFR